jgi:hypothetical protein
MCKVSYFFNLIKDGNWSGTVMRGEQGGAIQKSAAAEANAVAAVQWQRTLWVMVGIQFIMTGAFSVLSPIMPLLLPELGVETASAVDLWAGILNGVTSFVAAFEMSLAPSCL